MAKAVFDELKKPDPKNSFTVGITDDVSHTSLEVDPEFSVEAPSVTRAVFYGLGADGTVGANKNSAKIIAEDAGLCTQAYFVYDSHKSGAQTVSHLRFGPEPIRAPYLIASASFVACHVFGFLARQDVLRLAAPAGVFLLNSPFAADAVWDYLPRSVQQQIIDKRLRFFVIDASRVAREVGLGVRTNTVLQTCFFAISGVLPRERAIHTSRKRSVRPMPARARPWFARTTRRLTPRSSSCKRPGFRRPRRTSSIGHPSCPMTHRTSCAG
jgi:pyruvate-ferredoxin/flavodoxin oxidoreductase